MDDRFISKEHLNIDEELGKLYLNSKVVSGTTGYMKNGFLDAPANFIFQHIQVGTRQETFSSWNFLVSTPTNPMMGLLDRDEHECGEILED